MFVHVVHEDCDNGQKSPKSWAKWPTVTKKWQKRPKNAKKVAKVAENSQRQWGNNDGCWTRGGGSEFITSFPLEGIEYGKPSPRSSTKCFQRTNPPISEKPPSLAFSAKVDLSIACFWRQGAQAAGVQTCPVDSNSSPTGL